MHLYALSRAVRVINYQTAYEYRCQLVVTKCCTRGWWLIESAAVHASPVETSPADRHGPGWKLKLKNVLTKQPCVISDFKDGYSVLTRTSPTPSNRHGFKLKCIILFFANYLLTSANHLCDMFKTLHHEILEII